MNIKMIDFSCPPNVMKILDLPLMGFEVHLSGRNCQSSDIARWKNHTSSWGFKIDTSTQLLDQPLAING
jgi:hypothetical protein